MTWLCHLCYLQCLPILASGWPNHLKSPRSGQQSAHHDVQLDLGAAEPAAERRGSHPAASEARQRHILGPRLRHGQQPWRQIPILTCMRLQAPAAVTPGAALQRYCCMYMLHSLT